MTISIHTKLINKQSSFDSQFSPIRQSIQKHDISHDHIFNKDDVIKIFVGTQVEQMLVVKVLEYSIMKHTKRRVEVIPLCNAEIEIPMPKKQDNQPRTPFSFQRFLIPQLCNYQGKAIYVDSDMQVFKDINILWGLPMGNNDLLSATLRSDKARTPQYSVMLLDCEKLKWDIQDIVSKLDNGTLTYKSLMEKMIVAKNPDASISCTWNSLEYFERDKTGLLHYTDMNKQPWVSTKNPLAYIWVKALKDAIDDGFIDERLLDEHRKLGWVRPSLVYQIENNIVSLKKLSKRALDLDKDFIFPWVQD
jgi:hypothetical protein